MSPKTVFVICAQIFLVQQAYSQVQGYGNLFGPSYGTVSQVDVTAVDVGSFGFGNVGSLGATGLGGIGLGGIGLGSAGMGVASLGATTSPAFLNLNGLAAGGVLPISSVGPIIPAGLRVVSDNAIEGNVVINGQLPFLSAVAFEGSLPSAGSGISQCGCGTGNIGITSESVTPVASGLGGISGLGLGGFGMGVY